MLPKAAPAEKLDRRLGSSSNVLQKSCCPSLDHSSSISHFCLLLLFS